MKEASLKKLAEDYLTLLQNQDKLFFLRLNSGNLVVTDSDGKYRRRIRGCPSGTADVVVFTNNGRYDAPNKLYPIVIFLEFKSEKGRQTKEQREFETMVRTHGCQYLVIREFEELQEVLNVLET